MSNQSNRALTSLVSAVFTVACLAVPGLAHAKRPSLSQFPFTYGSTTTSGVTGTGGQTVTHGQSGQHGHSGTLGQSQAQHGHNPQYLLVTMRGGSSLQGSQMNQLRRQGGASLRLVQSDGAGNYLMQVQRHVSASTLTNIENQLKNNANVLSVSPATVGSKSMTANVGDTISVAAADLMNNTASTGSNTASGSNTATSGTSAATGDQWHQLAGQTVTLANPNSDTLSFTVPQITTDSGGGSTDGSTAGSGAGGSGSSSTLTTNSTGTGSSQGGQTQGQSGSQGMGHHLAFVHHPHVGHGGRLEFELISPQSNGTVFVGNVVIQVQDTTAPTYSGSDTSGGTADNSGASSSGSGM